MCDICAMVPVYDPSRHAPETDPTVSALRHEVADAGNWTDTAYTMAPSDSFFGYINISSDQDWLRVELVAGSTYVFSLESAPSGGGSMLDPTLEFFDGRGILLARDFDGGAGTNALLNVTATTSGAHYIAASSNWGTGSYTLTMTQTGGASAPTSGGSTSSQVPEATLDELATYLISGYWADQGSQGRAFDTSSSNILYVDLSGLTVEGRTLARWALEAWEMVIDVDFRERTSNADITFQDHEPGAFASAGFSWSGNITSATVNVSQSDWVDVYGATIDSYSMSTYIHEIGHAIGLGHLGNYNGAGTFAQDAKFANDSVQMSVMSYFSQSDNPNTTASDAETISAMMADIAAAQSLYGAAGAGSATDGATVWGKNSTLGGYWGSYFGEVADGQDTADYSGEDVAFTIFDSNGIDLVDLSFLATNDRIDLRAERFSDVGGLIGNVGVARGTVVENLLAGNGANTITGNTANNILAGGAGNDTIRAGAGDDILLGGAGQDVLSGGSGADTFFFDLSNNGSGDRVTDYAAGRFDVGTRSYTGDLLYFENGVISKGRVADDLIVGGVTLEGAGNGNLAYYKPHQGGSVISQIEGGDFSLSNFAAYIIEIEDRGTEESFDWEQIIYAEGGAVREHRIYYDSDLRVQTEYDYTDSKNFVTIVEQYIGQEHRDYFQRVVEYDDGQMMRERYDRESNQAWSLIRENHDDAGALFRRYVAYDDQSQVDTTYDVQGASNWETYQQFREQGLLSERRFLFDDGTQQREIFDLGSAAWQTIFEYRTGGSDLYDKRFVYDDNTEQRTLFDTAGSQIWSTIQEYRDAANALYDKRTNYDDDSQLRTVFDVATATWDRILEYRDAVGRIYDKRTDYDNGTQTRTVWDVEADDAWTSIVESRNDVGALFKKNVNFDNGNYQIVLYDVDNTESWDIYARTFDNGDTLLASSFA